MLDGFRFRRYPNHEQEQVFLRWIGSRPLMYQATAQADRYDCDCPHRVVRRVWEKIPVDHPCSRFISENTALLKQVPSPTVRGDMLSGWHQATFPSISSRMWPIARILSPP